MITCTKKSLPCNRYCRLWSSEVCAQCKNATISQVAAEVGAFPSGPRDGPIAISHTPSWQNENCVILAMRSVSFVDIRAQVHGYRALSFLCDHVFMHHMPKLLFHFLSRRQPMFGPFPAGGTTRCACSLQWDLHFCPSKYTPRSDANDSLLDGTFRS